MVEGVELKLASWQAKGLSISGRVTLIQSALENLPVDFMSLYKCPISSVNQIERLENFLWQKNKFHHVDWVLSTNLRGMGSWVLGD